METALLAAAATRPAPTIDGESEPFWAAARDGKLLISGCDDCGHRFFPARIICPGCHSVAVAPLVASGEGSVYSYTVSRRPAAPDFAEVVPYVVALIDLDEGARMLSNVIGCDPSDVGIGARVSVRYLPIDNDLVLPVFELAAPVDGQLDSRSAKSTGERPEEIR